MRAGLLAAVAANLILAVLFFLSYLNGSAYAPPAVIFVRLSGGIAASALALLCVLQYVFMARMPAHLARLCALALLSLTVFALALFACFFLEGSIRY
jgi:hypothetical protein